MAKLMAKATQLPIIESPSRGCFAKHGVATEEQQRVMSAEAKFALQSSIFDAISQQYNTYHTGIFERTLLDNFFYLMYHSPELASQQLIESMESGTADQLFDVDMLFFFPLYDWKTVDDGMRTTLYAPRRIMDLAIEGFLNKYKIPHFRVSNTSPEERLKAMLEVTGYAQG